jgi:ribosomal protein S19E (S16A)
MDGIDWTDKELCHELKKIGSLKEDHGELVLCIKGKRLLDGKLLHGNYH